MNADALVDLLMEANVLTALNTYEAVRTKMFVSILAANWPHGIGFALLFVLFYLLFCRLPLCRP